MNTLFHDAMAEYARTLVTAIALINNDGSELAGGDYERLSVEWTAPVNGVIRPTTNLTFRVPPNSTVAGWVGFDSAAGTLNYGGAPLSLEVYGEAGTYTLLAAETGIEVFTP